MLIQRLTALAFAIVLACGIASGGPITGTFTGTVTNASDPGQASFGRDPADWVGRSVSGTFVFDVTAPGVSDGDPASNVWTYSDPNSVIEWVSVTASIDGVNFSTAPPDAGASVGDVVRIIDDSGGDLLGPQDSYISAAGRSVVGFDLFGSDALLTYDGVDSMTLDYSGGGGIGTGIIEDLLTSAGRSGLINFALTNVTILPRPNNDDFANRISLPGSSTTVSGSNVAATGEIGEADHAGVSAPSASVWWSWEAPVDGQLTVSTAGSSFDTTLAAYTGSSVDALTEVAANDDFIGLTSEIDFAVTAGEVYSIAVDGYDSSQGDIDLLLIFVPDEPHFALTRILENPSPDDGDEFGKSVSVDGERALVGSPRDDNGGFFGSGRAYLFDAVTGGEIRAFDSPSPDDSNLFGWSVSLDGDSVLVGSLFSFDAVGDDTSLFDAATGAVLQTFENPLRDDESFGGSVSVAGDRVLIADPGYDIHVGRVYLFDALSGSLVRSFANPSPDSFDDFGQSVSVDGDRVLIGVPGDDFPSGGSGRAYLFDAVSGDLVHTFNNPSTTDFGEFFGTSVSVDGDNVLIGSPRTPLTPQAGAPGFATGRAYLFDAATGALVHTFDNPSPGDNDEFGTAVSIDGDRILIGTPYDDNTGNDFGSVYLFDAMTGALVQEFENPSPGNSTFPYDNYGGAVSVNADRLLISAMGDDTTGDNSGRAYLYEPDSDGDGIADSVETITADSDSDGVPDYLDLDSDDNGIPDAIEVGSNPANPADGDGNAVPDFRDLDNDGDGVLDTVEIGSDPNNPYDWDLDGIPDYIDANSQAGLGGDTHPDPPGDFTPQTDVPLDSYVISDAVVITGINEPAVVSVTGGEYSRGCTGSWSTSPGLVIAGDSVCVRQLTANAFSVSQDTVLSVGAPAETSIFTTTTAAFNEFGPGGFLDQTNVTLGEEITSNIVTVSGLGGAAPISVIFGEYAVGCTEPFTTDPGNVSDGQTVCVRHANQIGGSSTMLTIGAEFDIFSSTIDSFIDSIPDVFSFPPYPGFADLSELLVSDVVTITGINVPTLVVADWGDYSIGCFDDDEWDYSASPGLIAPGQTVCSRHRSADTHSTLASSQVTIGGISAIFESITLGLLENPIDVTPNQFYFQDRGGVPMSTVITSAPVNIWGIEAPASVSVIGGLYSVGCSDVFTSALGQVSNGESVCVRHTSASTLLTETHSILKVGAVTDRFTATTSSTASAPPDDDDDGIENALDNCPSTENPFQEDGDGDTVGDVCDNCSVEANANQRDTNGDGYGNLCDADFNGNGIVDPADFSLLKSRFGQGGFPDQDLNGNGVVDPFDFSLLKSMFGQPPGPSGTAP